MQICYRNTIEIEGSEHSIELQKESAFSYSLIIDNIPKIVKQGMREYLLGTDIGFKIGAAELHIAQRNRRFDIAVNGNFLSDGASYQKAKLPIYTYIFLFLNILLPIQTLGGLIPIIAACIGCRSCIRIFADYTNTAAKNSLKCSGITFLCWGISFGLIYMFMPG